MKKYFIVIFLFSFSSSLFAQARLLDNEGILKEVNAGLSNMYNFKFPEARNSLEKVRRYSPGHPAVSFMEGLIVYWENYPLGLEGPAAARFTYLMEDCIKRSERMLQLNSKELEAIFFDLFGRAFYVMYFSDNGKPGKVFPHMNSLYRETMKGFELKDKFVEFYFSTGLYNYYIEAYPDKNPAYKPITFLFHRGNRELGLKQLDHAANNAVFLKAEANFFLSLLYLNYEKNFEKASYYAARLYREYPDNPFYTGNYLEILLYNKKFFMAPILIDRLQKSDLLFSKMQAHLYRGYYLEKYKKDYESSKQEYLRALSISKDFGYYARHYDAVAQMGLGRYYSRKGDRSSANSYFREARNSTGYEYILNDN